MLPCDVCLEPAGPTVLPAELPIMTCIDCYAFTVAAGLSFADAADFLEMRRMSADGSAFVSQSMLRRFRHTVEDCLATHYPAAPPLVPDESADALRMPPAPPDPPALAAEIIRPGHPDRGEPDAAANVVQLWQWPAHCGQWFALAGSCGHVRSVQYGPCRTAEEALTGLARNLALRGYRWDGGYAVPAPAGQS